jgi:aryl-alcohol dehydrogenase-like predicted oxidoreductase
MRTTTLADMTVSRLCLGTMLMGGATPADEAERILDRFLEAGGNLLDTADTYGDGASERTLAPWLARHRDEVVVATKVRYAVSDPGGEGLAPGRIRAACDASRRTPADPRHAPVSARCRSRWPCTVRRPAWSGPGSGRSPR